MIPGVNRRVLLIDDMPSIHEDFRKILCPAAGNREYDELEAALFGSAPGLPAPRFELDVACQGQEGLAKVEESLREGRPYAMAFVDVRMPPGWDGLETVERLWRVDADLQVVICTAYSDHPWSEFLARLDVRDRLLVLKKPFDLIEVSQLATTLTSRWTLARQASQQAAELHGFAHSVSRDLRSPLMVVNAFSQLLEEALDEPRECKVRHYLDRIRAGAAQSEELIEGLIRVAGIERARLSMEIVDLGQVARTVLQQLRAKQPERSVRCSVGEARVFADAALLKMVVSDLIDNAWKFTSRKDVAHIEFGCSAQDQEVVCFVRDNGAGFDPALSGRIFEGLQRLHHASEFPGAGTGLLAARRALARHGGRIWADAAPGRGATFYFSVPRQPHPVAAANSRQEALP